MNFNMFLSSGLSSAKRVFVLHVEFYWAGKYTVCTCLGFIVLIRERLYFEFAWIKNVQYLYILYSYVHKETLHFLQLDIFQTLTRASFYRLVVWMVKISRKNRVYIVNGPIRNVYVPGPVHRHGILNREIIAGPRACCM